MSEVEQLVAVFCCAGFPAVVGILKGSSQAVVYLLNWLGWGGLGQVGFFVSLGWLYCCVYLCCVPARRQLSRVGCRWVGVNLAAGFGCRPSSAAAAESHCLCVLIG